MNQRDPQRFPHRQQKILNKFERENLFQKAEKLYISGDKVNAVPMFLSCLQNLDTYSVFSSLPKCLRALSSHYLEQQDYMKSIHFVQAERMYYESALIDAAALQQKLIDLAYHHRSPDDKSQSNVNFCQIEMQNYETRIFEYERMTRYFMNHNKFDMALELARKSAKLNHKLYGSNNSFTKDSLCKVRDIEVKIKRGKNNMVIDTESNYNKISQEFSYSESGEDKKIQKYKGIAPKVSRNHKSRHRTKIVIYTVKELVRFIVIWSVLLAFTVIVLMLLYSLLIILHNYLMPSVVFIEIQRYLDNLTNIFIRMLDFLLKHFGDAFINLFHLTLEYFY